MFDYKLDATLCSQILRDLRHGPLHRASRTSTTVEDPVSSSPRLQSSYMRHCQRDCLNCGLEVVLKLVYDGVHSNQGHPKALSLWRSQCGRIEAGADWSHDSVILVACRTMASSPPAPQHPLPVHRTNRSIRNRFVQDP